MDFMDRRKSPLSPRTETDRTISDLLRSFLSYERQWNDTDNKLAARLLRMAPRLIEAEQRNNNVMPLSPLVKRLLDELAEITAPMTAAFSPEMSDQEKMLALLNNDRAREIIMRLSHMACGLDMPYPD